VVLHFPDYDSFELGIKGGEEWWFEGDIFKIVIENFAEIMILTFEDYKWGFKNPNDFVPRILYDFGFFMTNDMKLVGNIHDNPELILPRVMNDNRI